MAKNEVKILVACGSGAATSTIAQEEVKKKTFHRQTALAIQRRFFRKSFILFYALFSNQTLS